MVMRTSPSLGMYVLGALPFLLAVVGIARLSEPLSQKATKELRWNQRDFKRKSFWIAGNTRIC